MFPKAALGETWPLRIMDIDFLGRFTAFRARNMGHDKSVAYWSAIPFVFIYFMLVAHKREDHASPRAAS